MTNGNFSHDMPPPSPPPPEDPRPSSHDAVAASRKKKAKRRLIAIAVAVVVIAIAAWYIRRSLSLPLQNVTPAGASVETSVSSSQLAQNFSAPSPLQQAAKVIPKKANTLTDAGVIVQTNLQRAQNGNLPPLTENPTLDDIATLRIADMFAQQYFAHVGPQGESAITVASSVGYAYLALGENLALGNYAGDAGVVSAWMGSPGHRANILDMHYTQIGVAVREGMFQGAETWIAVQVFGRPASDCPAPDANVETTINLAENQINAMAVQLQSDKIAIDAMDPQSGPDYNTQVENYNDLAAQYNNLAAETKTAITAYDAEVTAFNACLEE
ncbi:MAG TPA: CAP domain-containing protein [Candidatus Paceibacterota bacterium]|nr:CAP domain-containing protein [Candidatus Paceibacterota bacterium]